MRFMIWSSVNRHVLDAAGVVLTGARRNRAVPHVIVSLPQRWLPQRIFDL
jgi:hypothetical protein